MTLLCKIILRTEERSSDPLSSPTAITMLRNRSLIYTIDIKNDVVPTMTRWRRRDVGLLIFYHHNQNV